VREIPLCANTADPSRPADSFCRARFDPIRRADSIRIVAKPTAKVQAKPHPQPATFLFGFEAFVLARRSRLTADRRVNTGSSAAEPTSLRRAHRPDVGQPSQRAGDVRTGPRRC